jgi:hypothetical protein
MTSIRQKASSLFKKGPQKAKHDKTVSTQKPEPVPMTSESLPPRPSSIDASISWPSVSEMKDLKRKLQQLAQTESSLDAEFGALEIEETGDYG